MIRRPDWLDRMLGHVPGRGPRDWMCTISGRQYFVSNPRAADVNILDIAHHLSRLCRYTGAIEAEHYSVAEHSVHVSHLVPHEHALAGLMHDATEAYIADLNRPTKLQCADYQRLEDANWRVIAPVFGLPFELDPCVKAADTAMLARERDVLMPNVPAWLKPHWPRVELDASRITILALSPNKAKQLFLDRYYELTSGLGQPQCGRPTDGSPRTSVEPSYA